MLLNMLWTVMLNVALARFRIDADIMADMVSFAKRGTRALAK